MGVQLPVTTRVRGYAAEQTVHVHRVLDGDSVLLADGRRVRLTGIVAPSPSGPGAPLAAAALSYWIAQAREVQLEICPEQPTDDRASVQGYLALDGVDVQGALVQYGLVRAESRPPCGFERANKYAQLQAHAVGAGAGLWAMVSRIPSCAVDGWDGRWVRIYGEVSAVKLAGNELRVDLGKKRSCARVTVSRRVLWSDGQGAHLPFVQWADAQSNAYLMGRTVEVIGALRREGRRAELQLSHSLELTYN